MRQQGDFGGSPVSLRKYGIFYNLLFALETSADTQMLECLPSGCLEAFCKVCRSELYIHSIRLP